MARIVKRSALIAGVECYRHLDALVGPEEDAQAMHALLSGPAQMRVSRSGPHAFDRAGPGVYRLAGSMTLRALLEDHDRRSVCGS